MLTTIGSRPFVIVLLDSAGRYTRLGDAHRVRHWIETGEMPPAPVVTKPGAKSIKVKSRVAGTLPVTKVAQNGRHG